MKQPIDRELAAEALKEILGDIRPRTIGISDIQRIVGSYYRVSIADLISKRRTRNIAFPRQIAMYLCRELTDASLPKIGEAFGGRDHTTVIHAHEKIGKMLQDDSELRQAIDELKKRILL